MSAEANKFDNASEDFSQPRKKSFGYGLFSILVNIFVILLIGFAGFLAWNKYINKSSQLSFLQPKTNLIQETPTPLPSQEVPNTTVDLSSQLQNISYEKQGIGRMAMPLTTIPDRPSQNIVTYTVQTGDTLFTIADIFKIKPETLLWGNYDTLQDNPHFLKPGQVLTVLPVNGTYYQWTEGDTIEKVAAYFNTTPDDILSFTANNIDLTKLSEKDSGIQPGTWIIVPNGKRAIKDWGPPAITRSNPASARYYGAGSCGSVYEGAVGTGSFVWPTTDHTISGNQYNPNVHPAIDIGGQLGNPVYAADTGVVVYSGWSDFGYGYLLVIDHGNGWQSAYAHLNSVGASCGQSVIRGGLVATLGSTGNSTGPHLHFELIFNGVKVNPLEYVQ